MSTTPDRFSTHADGDYDSSNTQSGYKRQRTGEGSYSSGGRACFKCGQTDHIARDCTNEDIRPSFYDKYAKIARTLETAMRADSELFDKVAALVPDFDESADVEEIQYKDKRGAAPARTSSYGDRGSSYGGRGGSSYGDRSGPMKCHRCGGPHMIRDCPQPDDRVCRTCGETGHISTRCPQGGSSYGGGRGGGRGSYGGRSSYGGSSGGYGSY
jgi:hypothetical protein